MTADDEKAKRDRTDAWERKNNPAKAFKRRLAAHLGRQGEAVRNRPQGNPWPDLRGLVRGRYELTEPMTATERIYVAQLLDVAVRIARGRHDNGRPLAAEIARQMAREALATIGENWKLPSN